MSHRTWPPTWPPTWPLLKKVDSFLLADGTERWIIHAGGCQRSMTADGLCSCVEPATFDIRADGSGSR
jgi:hypothetical protein